MTNKEPTKFARFYKSATTKIRSAVTDPRVVRVTQMANSTLSVLSHIGQARLTGPTAIIGTVLGTIDTIRTNLHLDTPDAFDDFIQEYVWGVGSSCVFDEKNSMIGELLMRTDSFKRLETETIFNQDGGSKRVEKVLDVQGKQLLFVVNGKANKASAQTDKPDDGKEYVERAIFVEEGFDFSILSEAVWSAIGSKFVKLVMINHGIDLVAVEEEDFPYLGQHSPVDFANIIERYHARGISRAASLFGPPGSGKTTFVRAYARHTGGRLLIVPPETLANQGREEIEMFVNLLLPDSLLLDDLDSAYSGAASVMTMVVDLRRKYPKMVVFTTANDFKLIKWALLRPGRLGERLEFLAPSQKDKLLLLSKYMKHYQVDEKLYKLPLLVAQMKHAYFTHDYVRFIAEQAVVMEQAELMGCVKDTNTFLTENDESYSPSDD